MLLGLMLNKKESKEDKEIPYEKETIKFVNKNSNKRNK